MSSQKSDNISYIYPRPSSTEFSNKLITSDLLMNILDSDNSNIAYIKTQITKKRKRSDSHNPFSK